jgi:hypothetical protein
MNWVCSVIGLCLLAVACPAAETGAGDSPIAFTLAAPATRAKDLAHVVLRAKYTNVGSNTVAVYDFLRISNGPLPTQQGSWFCWTRLLVSTGKEFREFAAEATTLIKALPHAEPITLTPGQSHEFSIPLSNFHLDLPTSPRLVLVCSRYVVQSPFVPGDRLVWLGTLNSNVLRLDLGNQR